VRDATLLAQLKPKAEDPEFRARWRAIKTAKKEALAGHIKEVTGITVPTNALYDVHVSGAPPAEPSLVSFRCPVSCACEGQGSRQRARPPLLPLRRSCLHVCLPSPAGDSHP
jgi:hypothetical protein